MKKGLVFLGSGPENEGALDLALDFKKTKRIMQHIRKVHGLAEYRGQFLGDGATVVSPIMNQVADRRSIA